MRIKEDLALIDPPQAQIVIEAVITDVSREKGTTIGIEWGQPIQASAEGAIEIARGVKLGYTSKAMGNILATLAFLRQKGQLDIKATPKIAVLENEEAEISIVTEQYFALQKGGSTLYPYLEIEAIKSGVTLKVTPRLTRDGEIIVKFEPEVSDVVASQGGGQNLPIISRRGTKTTVRVHDGETVVVGGLYQRTERKIESMLPIPLLSSIPIINTPLKRTKTDNRETELVLFITPKILK